MKLVEKKFGFRLLGIGGHKNWVTTDLYEYKNNKEEIFLSKLMTLAYYMALLFGRGMDENTPLFCITFVPHVACRYLATSEQKNKKRILNKTGPEEISGGTFWLSVIIGVSSTQHSIRSWLSQ